MGLNPGLGRSPAEGNNNLLQYFCLGNPMDKGDWWAAVHGIAESNMTEQLILLTKIKKKKSKGRNNIEKSNKYNCDNDAKKILGSPKLRLLCIRGRQKGYPNCLRDLLMLRESSGKATTNTVKRPGPRKTCIWSFT